MTLAALIGAKALYLLYIWLVGAIAASYLSERKGYGEKPGLASGMLLSIIGPIVWLFVPAKSTSAWKKFGPFGTTPKRKPAAAPPPPAAPPAAGPKTL